MVFIFWFHLRERNVTLFSSEFWDQPPLSHVTYIFPNMFQKQQKLSEEATTVCQLFHLVIKWGVGPWTWASFHLHTKQILLPTEILQSLRSFWKHISSVRRGREQYLLQRFIEIHPALSTRWDADLLSALVTCSLPVTWTTTSQSFKSESSVHTAKWMQTTYFKNKTMVSQVQIWTSDSFFICHQHKSMGKGGPRLQVWQVHRSILGRAAMSGKVLSILGWPLPSGFKN